MANGLPDIVQFNPIGALMQGQQFAQQRQDAQQINQLRALQLQQGQEQMARDASFRNELAAYLQGGSGNLAALYAADPERAMQVQAFQAQQNQLLRQQKIEQAKQQYAAAQYVLASAAPKALAETQFPQVVAALKESGVDWDSMSDADVRQLAEQLAAEAGSLAGIAPEYTGPEAAQVGGRDVFVQMPKSAVGAPRIVPGVTPRPQKPLVEINTRAESEAAKAYGKAEGEAFSALVQRGQDAMDKAAQLRAMRENPAITGPTQDFQAAANSFFADLGVPISPQRVAQISNLAQYKSIQNQLVLTEQLKQKGPQTESDAKRIAQTFGTTKNIQEANRLILNYQLALAEREVLLAALAEDYRERTGKIDGWRKELREYVRQTPLAGIDPQSKRLVFWNEFMDAMREDNPGMSDEDIMGYWRQRYGTGR